MAFFEIGGVTGNNSIMILISRSSGIHGKSSRNTSSIPEPL
jgi:hypothetical protein